MSKYSRHKIAIRDKNRCFFCSMVTTENGSGGDANLYGTLDHLVPQTLGGTNDSFNLVISCSECNNFKGPRPPTHYENSVIFRRKQISNFIMACKIELEILNLNKAGHVSMAIMKTFLKEMSVARHKLDEKIYNERHGSKKLIAANMEKKNQFLVARKNKKLIRKLKREKMLDSRTQEEWDRINLRRKLKAKSHVNKFKRQ